MDKILTSKTVVAAAVLLAAAVFVLAFSAKTYYEGQISSGLAPAIIKTPNQSPPTFSNSVTATSTKVKYGTLKGKISIGPLCPVEPCKITPERIMEIYKNRKIFIYSRASKEKVGQTAVKADGSYQLSLAEGKYIINVSDYQGKETSLSLDNFIPGNSYPQNADIAAGKATVLDFDIDTGIR